jgi:hypothetical protein
MTLAFLDEGSPFFGTAHAYFGGVLLEILGTVLKGHLRGYVDD